MAFSQSVVGCLVKKGLQKGGHGYPRTPLATPLVSRADVGMYRESQISLEKSNFGLYHPNNPLR